MDSGRWSSVPKTPQILVIVLSDFVMIEAELSELKRGSGDGGRRNSLGPVCKGCYPFQRRSQDLASKLGHHVTESKLILLATQQASKLRDGLLR